LFGVLPVRAVLYTLTHDTVALVANQVLDGIAAGIFGVVSVLVIADLTLGSGRFNFTLGVIATAVGLGAALSQVIALNWNVDSNLYYNVYRAASNGAPYSLIATVSSNSFVDLNASSNNVPYYYVVTGLNAFGDESAYSPQAAATVGAVWRQEWFGTTANTGSAEDTADPAGDGVINLLKRAFNMNPLMAQTNGIPYGTLNAGNFTLTYRKSLAATDLIFQVQCSGDLVNWTTSGITDTVVSSDGFTEVHTATIPVTSAEQFMRLNVIPTQ
jgi:hypothetical protein